MRRTKEIINRRPVDKTAALVTSGGVTYTPAFKDGTPPDYDVCPEMMPWSKTRKIPSEHQLTDMVRGRLTVVGKSVIKGMWVCRCLCGKFTLRSAKAIKNPRNDIDGCRDCRQLNYLRRHEKWISMGSPRDCGERY